MTDQAPVLRNRPGRHYFAPILVIPAMLLASACLTPTDAGSRFGEARIQPEFVAGGAPGDLGLTIDSIRTIIRPSGSGAVATVDTVMPWGNGGARSWIIELSSAADAMEVTLELRVGSNTAYEGTRSTTVVEGTAGRAPVEMVPVSYTGTDLVTRIDVVPDMAVFNVIGTTRQLEAIAYDVLGAVVPGEQVAWSSADPSVAVVDAAGIVTAIGIGTTSISASADGATGSATISVDTTLSGSSTITADSSAINADGASTTLLTVEVLDVNGNPVGASAGVVVLATTLGTLGPVIDHENGTYTATLTAGTIAGTAAITGTLGGVAVEDSALVELRPLDADPGATTITADSTSMNADGASTSLVTVEVVDANGNLIGTSGGTLVLSTTLGNLGAVTDHADGTYTATLTAGTMAGTAVVTGTLDGNAIADEATVVLRPLAGDPTTTTITADSASIAVNGVSATIVTVAVLDVNGNPTGRSAGVVTISSTLGILSEVVDREDGTYTAVLTADTTHAGDDSAAAGTQSGTTWTWNADTDTAVITATLNAELIADTALIEFRHEPGDPLTTTIDADSTSLELGTKSWTTVTVTVRDASGNRVHRSAGIVELCTTRGWLSPVHDNGDGTYTAFLVAEGYTAGTAVVTGTLNGVTIPDSAAVEFRE